MDMEFLQSIASNPYWDDEASSLDYLCPLKCSWTVEASPDSHIGPFKHALDFLVPLGTRIYAVADGIIIEIQEHCNIGGDGQEFRDYLNYVTIQHDNGEFSQYCHLARGSVSKRAWKIRDYIRTGDEIGDTGISGWMDKPHLHFILFRNDTNPANPLHRRIDGGWVFKSLKLRF